MLALFIGSRGMKDLNWEQGLVRVYYVLWGLLVGSILISEFLKGGTFHFGNLVWFLFVFSVIPALVLKVLRWGIPWLIAGFVKKET